MQKPTLVYFNPDSFADTDVTVLKFLTDEFNVIWFYRYESQNSGTMRYKLEEVSKYANDNDITLELIDRPYRNRSFKNILLYKNIAKRINDYNPDVVYSGETVPFWGLCFRTIKCRNKVLGLHDVRGHSGNFTIAKFLLNYTHNKIINKFNNILTFSSNQHLLLKEKYGKDSIMVGMSYKYFGESKKKCPPINEGVRLLFFGSINQYKGLDLLIQSLEELRIKGVDNIRLTIAGNGGYWNYCESLIKTSEMYNLYIRFIDNQEIPDLMSSHHFLVLPYRDATQSGPLLTALGYNLPIIAPNFGCFSDVYTEDSAILYKSGHLSNALSTASLLSGLEYENMRNAVASIRDNYSEKLIANNYLHAFSCVTR